MKHRTEKSAFREYAESIIVAVVLALVMRQFVVQAFKIPSESMKATLLIGDHILVNKFLYYFSSPQRADIIVFRYPWEEDRDFIKRIVGLPGDRVEFREGRVYVNGNALEEPYIYPLTRGRDSFGPILVPKKGDKIEIRADKRLYLNGEPVPIPPGSFFPHDHGPAMTGFEVFYARLLPAGASLQQPLEPRLVEHDQYFALGDNRDNSKDSRYWGFVSSTRLRGKAFFIYWSWDQNGHFVDYIRWDRLGKLLNLRAL